MGKILEFKQLEQPEEEEDNQKPPRNGGRTPFLLLCLILLIVIMSVIVFKDDIKNLFPVKDQSTSVGLSASPSPSASVSPEISLPIESSPDNQATINVSDDESITNLQKKISLESTAENQFFDYQSGFLCVNSTEMIYYDSEGNKKSSYPLNVPDPVVSVCGKYIAVGSRGSHELVLLKDMQVQRKETLPANLTAVDITEKGDYAVVCEDESYKSRLILKNIAGEELFVWLSADGYITSVDFSKSGKNIAVATLNTGDQIASEILLFDIYKTEPIARQKYSNEMILSLQMTDNNSVMALFEQKARVLDKEGNPVREYDYRSLELTSYAWDKSGNLVLAFWDNGGGKIVVLSSFDEQNQEKVFVTGTEIEQVSLCGNRIVLAFANQVYVRGLDTSFVFNTALPQDASVEDILVFQSGDKALIAKKTAAYIIGVK